MHERKIILVLVLKVEVAAESKLVKLGRGDKCTTVGVESDLILGDGIDKGRYKAVETVEYGGNATVAPRKGIVPGQCAAFGD